MSATRRRSSLLFELGRAQGKIATLEEFIRDRERQFRATVLLRERQDSQGTSSRTRRAGLSHDMLRVRSMSHEEQEEIPDEVFSKPLAEYISLTISRIVHHSDGSYEPVPFMLRRLVSREYHVGPEGAVIGSSPEADVSLPHDTGLWDKHVEIKWISGGGDSKLAPQDRMTASFDESCGGYFLLRDLTKGCGVFYVSRSGHQYSVRQEYANIHEIPSLSTEKSISLTSRVDESTSCQSFMGMSTKFDIMLTNGVGFVAGQLEFCLTALPLEQLLTIRSFSAARNGNLPRLKAIIKSTDQHRSVSVHTQLTAHSNVSEGIEGSVDINSEYSSPSYGEESFFDRMRRLTKTSAHMVEYSVPHSPVSSTSVTTTQSQPHKLLLHVAIENRDAEMVLYLLENGADPNKCTGKINQNALHLAARLNLEKVMVELLKYGGDVEIKDSYLHQPLALTTSYEIRKLLLSAVMLCAAAEAGDLDEVNRLLSSTQVSPNACGLHHKSALHLASAKGHTNVVKCLLLNDANVNAKGGSRWRTPLHYASLNGNVHVAQLLLSAGANEFSRDSGGYTPLNLSLGGDMCKLLHKQPLSLCLAVQSGDLVEVKRILSACDNEETEDLGIVDQRNEQSHAPLHLACATGNIAIVRALVSHGADLNLHGGSDGWTPLFYASMAGNDDVVEFLLSVGASTEEVDSHGKTVQERVDKALGEIKEQLSKLEQRGRAGSLVEADVLLHTLEPASMTRQESSCSVEVEKEWLGRRHEALKLVSHLLISGTERLLIALEARNLSDFKELLASSIVDANTLIDKHNPIPVLIRACEDGLYEFAKVLLEHGARVNENGPMNQIPLMVAAANGYCDIVQLLVDKGANVNVQSLDTWSIPLHEAATANSLDVVEYLLESGADLSAKNASGEVPFDCSTSIEVRKVLASGANRLLVAASEGDSEMIHRLVTEEKVSPSHEFHHGITALHEACECGHITATQLLVDFGADVNKQIHPSQMSPLHIASRNNHIELGKVLLKAGAKLDSKDSDGKVPFEVAHTNQMRTILVEARSMKVRPIAIDEENSSSETCCMICMVNPINTIILPCGHQAFCKTCVAKISACALDRQTIREVITVYK